MRASRQSRSGGRALLAALAIAAASAAGAPVSQATTGEPVLLNEALLSHTGADTTEFVELYGTPGASLAGLSLLAVEGDSSQGPGTVAFRVDFAAGAHLGGNGFFLVGNPTGLGSAYQVTPDLAIGNESFQNGSQTLALVEAASAPPLGGTVSGSIVVRDAVAVNDGGSGDLFFFGAPQVGPDASGFLPPGVRRVSDGLDTDAPTDWLITSNSLDGSHTPTAATAYNHPPTADCGPPANTVAGTPTTAVVTASDPDGLIVDFSLAVAPDPGSVTLGTVTPSVGVGGDASAEVTVGSSTPAGSYDVTVTATNGDVTPLQVTCQLAVTVEAAPPDPTPDPSPVATDEPSMDDLHSLMDGYLTDGDVDGSKADLLADRLARVERFIAAGQEAAAQAQLQAFVNQVQGLSPRWVSPAAAGALATAARDLAEAISVSG